MLQTILDFLSKNITAIIGLVGVLIGALTTYFVQIGIGNRERKWQLEDEKRNNRIARFKNLTSRLDDINSFLAKKEQFTKEGFMNDSEVKKQIITEQSNIIGSFLDIYYMEDSQLDGLSADYFDNLIIDPINRQAIREISAEMIERVNLIIDQSYDEQKNYFHRFWLWLKSKIQSKSAGELE